MISISRLGSNSGAISNYYHSANEADESYREFFSDQITNEWTGGLADTLSLPKAADKETFKSLLEGSLPDGTQLGRIKDGKIEHQTGWDMTFNAPKSVSILALVAGDKRLIDAHVKAVKSTLDYIEKNTLKTRKSVDGKVVEERVEKGLFHNTLEATNRNNEPHLHTHSVLLNIAQRLDGAWRSLETNRLFDKIHTAGAYYRSMLALEVKSLGYDIETSQKEGFFEIKGVAKSLIKQLSTRSENDIKQAKEKHGFRTAKGLDKAAMYSRNRKSKESLSTSRERWKEQVSRGKHRLEGIVEAAKERVKNAFEADNEGKSEPTREQSDQDKVINGGELTPYKETPDEQLDASNEAIDVVSEEYEQDNDDKQGEHKPLDQILKEAYYHEDKRFFQASFEKLVPSFIAKKMPFDPARSAVNILSERDAVFQKKKLEELSLKLSTGIQNPAKTLNQLDKMIKDGSLVPTNYWFEGKKTEGFTTPESIKTELKIASLLEKGKRELQPLYTSKEAELEIASLSKKHDIQLTEGQEKALLMAATTPDRVAAVQGFAGVGKTTMLNIYKDLMDKKGQSLVMLAPTGTAREKIQDETGIKSQTMHSLLYQMESAEEHDRLPDYSNTTLIVDESSLIGSNNFHQLSRLSRLTNSRLMPLGDRLQLGAIEAGKPFIQTQNSGVDTAEMTEINRQKGNPKLLKSIYATINEDYIGALQLVDETTTEKSKSAELTAAMLDDYMQLNHQERDQSMLIIPDLDTQKEVNKAIQDRLKDKEDISKEGHKFISLSNNNVIEEEKRIALTYKVGMVLLDHEDGLIPRVKKGESLTVERSNLKEVVLKKEDGTLINFNPSSLKKGYALVLDLFKSQKIKIHQGDKFIWKRTNKEMGLNNGDRGIIEKINGDKATIQFEKGTKTIDLKKKNLAVLATVIRLIVRKGKTKRGCFFLPNHGESI